MYGCLSVCLVEIIPRPTRPTSDGGTAMRQMYGSRKLCDFLQPILKVHYRREPEQILEQILWGSP